MFVGTTNSPGAAGRNLMLHLCSTCHARFLSYLDRQDHEREAHHHRLRWHGWPFNTVARYS